MFSVTTTCEPERIAVARFERDRRVAHRGALTEKPVQDIGRLACCGLIGDRELMIQDNRGCHLFATTNTIHTRLCVQPEATASSINRNHRALHYEAIV